MRPHFPGWSIGRGLTLALLWAQAGAAEDYEFHPIAETYGNQAAALSVQFESVSIQDINARGEVLFIGLYPIDAPPQDPPDKGCEDGGDPCETNYRYGLYLANGSESDIDQFTAIRETEGDRSTCCGDEITSARFAGGDVIYHIDGKGIYVASPGTGAETLRHSNGEPISDANAAGEVLFLARDGLFVGQPDGTTELVGQDVRGFPPPRISDSGLIGFIDEASRGLVILTDDQSSFIDRRVSDFHLANDGSVLAWVPDEVEAGRYDLARLNLAGEITGIAFDNDPDPGEIYSDNTIVRGSAPGGIYTGGNLVYELSVPEETTLFGETAFPELRRAAGRQLAISSFQGGREIIIAGRPSQSCAVKGSAGCLCQTVNTWLTPTGGAFADSSNWEQGQPPAGTSDVATFSLDGEYAVTFGTGSGVCLNVNNGTVRFSGGRYPMNLGEGSSRSFARVFGAGSPALVLENGHELLVYTLTVGGAGGSGRLLVSQGSIVRPDITDVESGGELELNGGTLVGQLLFARPESNTLAMNKANIELTTLNLKAGASLTLNDSELSALATEQELAEIEGLVTISNQSKLRFAHHAIGNGGRLIATDSQVTFNNFIIGNVGDATASLQNTDLTTNALVIGGDAGGTGVLEIGPVPAAKGTVPRTTIDGLFVVGSSGHGTLRIRESIVNVTTQNLKLEVGDTEGGVGLVEVERPGTQFTGNGMFLSLGSSGDGTLRVLDSSMASMKGINAGSAAASGTGRVEVRGRAELQLNSPTGNTNLATAFESSHYLGIGKRSRLEVTSAATVDGYLAILDGGSSQAERAAAIVSGQGTTMTLEGLLVGISGRTNLVVEDLARVLVAGSEGGPMAVAGAATLLIRSGADLSTGAAWVGVTGFRNGLAPPGTLATVEIDQGLWTATEIDISPDPQANAFPIPLTGQQRGQVQLRNGGEIMVGTLRIHPDGELSGTGLVTGQVLNQGGTISPEVATAPPAPKNHPSPIANKAATAGGRLTIQGDFTQTGGKLRLEIAGTAAHQMDVLTVTGQTNLQGGTLVLAFTGAFAPVAGDVFPILDVAETTEANIEVVVEGLAPGFDFEWRQDPTSGALSVVALTDGVATSALFASSFEE